MADYKIEITIAPDGSIHSEVLNLKGTACEDIISIMDNLPGEVTGEGHTADYHEPEDDDPKREQHRTRPVSVRRNS